MSLYLDHAATTPVHPDVIEAMIPFWTSAYGNPSSIHDFGRKANTGLENARRSIADTINASPKEILFTGCGSESDNLAVRGVMWAARQADGSNHMITSCIEHKAILDTAKQLRDLLGFELTILPVDEFGRVSVEDVEAAIRPNTALISIMTANNEIGTIQPIEAIGALAREHDIIFHTDGVQAISTRSWNMQTLPIDLLSMAAHKFGGPKGVGVLYRREGVTLIPSMTGGGQEQGLRPGTSNVAFAVGAAKALEIVQTELADRVTHYANLKDHFVNRVLAGLGDGVVLTGHPTERLPFHTSFALRHLRGNDLLMHLDMGGVAASSGSACSVGNPKPSAILQAIGLTDEWTSGGLRFTFGHEHTLTDADKAVAVLTNAVEKLQRLAMYN